MKPFTQLERLIDALPSHSRYVSALMDDPELAVHLAAAPDPPDTLSMYGFDPHRALLSALLDAINQNTAATIAAAGAEPPEFEPAPRPVTEVDRAKQRQRHNARRGLAALALGKSLDEIE